MMAENPLHPFHALGITATLEGQDAIRNQYRQWSETGERPVLDGTRLPSSVTLVA
ncbi:hypothetical protein [Streptomyces sp. NPDC058463]|uniref:hypothetical protein n=1 Tax=Streptomyces sp. NPDC058463 TaxID=3346510 RepID=UPI00365B891F